MKRNILRVAAFLLMFAAGIAAGYREIEVTMLSCAWALLLYLMSTEEKG